MTVRALLRSRQLRGPRVGKGKKPGGVRVSLASIRAYKRRHTIGGEKPAEAAAEAPERVQERNPAHKEAMALLRTKSSKLVRNAARHRDQATTDRYIDAMLQETAAAVEQAMKPARGRPKLRAIAGGRS